VYFRPGPVTCHAAACFGKANPRAEQITGHRRFIRCTLGDVLMGRAAPAARAGTPVAHWGQMLGMSLAW